MARKGNPSAKGNPCQWCLYRWTERLGHCQLFGEEPAFCLHVANDPRDFFEPMEMQPVTVDGAK